VIERRGCAADPVIALTCPTRRAAALGTDVAIAVVLTAIVAVGYNVAHPRQRGYRRWTGLRRPGVVTGLRGWYRMAAPLLLVTWQAPAPGGRRAGMMTLQTNTASALVWALDRAHEHAGAGAALAAAGLDLPLVDRFDGLSDDFDELVRRLPGETSVREALALGILAGRVADRPARARRLQDPTSFLMNEDLIVQGARGQSILRLPWFEDGLFVGRELREISEMPTPVRRLCVENYAAALAGERGRFAFTSYGHAYSVDAVPVRSQNGRIDAVLAVATPAHSYAAAVAAHLRTAERLDRSAELAEECAERYRLAGRGDSELAELHAAGTARRGAERARASAQRLQARVSADPGDPPSITSRQAEVLSLASNGLTSAEIAEQIGVSATTVRSHFDNIYYRLGVSDRCAAVATALRHGLID
jgi:DNA-binding NarL/FixJ family response regulator